MCDIVCFRRSHFVYMYFLTSFFVCFLFFVVICSCCFYLSARTIFKLFGIEMEELSTVSLYFCLKKKKRKMPRHFINVTKYTLTLIPTISPFHFSYRLLITSTYWNVIVSRAHSLRTACLHAIKCVKFTEKWREKGECMLHLW